MNRNTACFLLDISADDIYDPCTGKMDRDRLRRQYRIQSLRLHPDKNPAPDAVEQFQRMNDAYIWLSETDRSETSLSETDRSETGKSETGKSETGMGNKNEMGTEMRSGEHTSELQSRFGISYAVVSLKYKHRSETVKSSIGMI